jgi:pimeloyl-ACP methyl ester carboxylesterase
MVRTETERLENGVDVAYRRVGGGEPVLLLHGSGGVGSLGALPDSLGKDHLVVAPSHPGFDGTGRPDWLTGIEQIAESYRFMLERLGLSDVTLVGLSMGGWIAMELALRAPERLARLVLIDPIGVQVPDHPILDVFALTPEEALSANYQRPEKFRPDPSTVDAVQVAAQAANLRATEVYTRSRAMHDPGLPERLGEIRVPALVLWGESERIVPLASVEAIVHHLGGPAHLDLIPGAGHRPQLEQPEQTERSVRAFMGTSRER